MDGVDGADGAAWGSVEVREVFAGAHRIRLEAPDLVYLTLVGDVTDAEAPVLLGEWARFAEERAWTLVLVDLGEIGVIAPGARRMSVSMPLKGRGTAAFGASFAARSQGMLLHRAYRLIHPGVDLPMSFHDGEDEARAWIHARRRTLGREVGERSFSG